MIVVRVKWQRIIYVIIQQKTMKSQITLKTSLTKLFGDTLLPVSDISSQWSLFAPYQFTGSAKIQYFRLLELPISYHTSEEICTRVEETAKGFLHPVKILLLERGIHTCYYLLRSQQNITSTRGLLELKKDSGQILQCETILKIIEFILAIKKKTTFQICPLTIDSIGMNESKNLQLCDYSLYFTHELAQQKNRRNSYENNMVGILTELVNLSSSVSKWQLFDCYRQLYGHSMAELIEAIFNDQDNIDHALKEVRKTIGSEVETTLTASMISIEEVNQIESSISMAQDMRSELSLKRNQKRVKKLLLGIAIFLILAIFTIGGFLVYSKYRMPKPLKCEIGEYEEDKMCRSCASGCVQCHSGQMNKCEKCQGNMFIVKNDSASQTGTCSKECIGKIFQNNTCVIPHVG